jgi:hypothetical protein
VNADEDCGGCVNRTGRNGAKWHRRRGQQSCEHARELERAYNGARWTERREGWVTGTPILVPEVDPL